MTLAIIETGKSQIQNPKSQRVDTPFGMVDYEQVAINGSEVCWLDRHPLKSQIPNPKFQSPKPKAQILSPVDSRAVAMAARLLGAEQVIGVVRDAGVERPVVPADFIEFSSGRPTTFFETMGAGYVQQEPPFCPEMSQALRAAGAETGRTLLVLDELPEAAERAWWNGRGVSLITPESQPEGALCRELELCYAVLVVPAGMQIAPLLATVVAHLPVERQCGCGTAVGGKWKLLLGSDVTH
jgi:5'-methylthioadenosine phosphorylase